MKLDKLTLMSGDDIPFSIAGITIHVPTIKEIGYIGEKDFLIGCHFLNFNKNILNDKDKSGLENQSNFNIFMSAMNSSDVAKHKADAIKVLTLLFPEYKIKIEYDKILLQLENFSSSLNEYNFEEFKEVIAQIFCLNAKQEDNFNPGDAVAARIAEKIQKGRAKRNSAKGQNLEDETVYTRYVSILSVGLKKDKNELLNYTVYQLMDEMERFKLKQDFDLYIQAKLAGAQDLSEVEDWMKSL